MFSHLFVCLFVTQKLVDRFSRNSVGRCDRLDFGTDLDPGMDTGSVFSIFPSRRDRTFLVIKVRKLRMNVHCS